MSIGRIPSNDPEAIKARLSFAKAQEDLRNEGLKSLGSVRKVQRAHEEMMKAEKLGHDREDARKKELAMSKSEIWHVKTILCALAVVACILALFDMPSNLYRVLRFIVLAASVAVIWDVQKGKASEQKKAIVSVVFGLLAVIFNPILPLEMERETWAWFDIMAVIGFVGYLHFSNPECIRWMAKKVNRALEPRSCEPRPFKYFRTGFNDEGFISNQLSNGCYKGKSMHPKVLRATWSMNFVKWIIESKEEGDSIWEVSRQFQKAAYGKDLDEDVFFSALKEAVNSYRGGKITIGVFSLHLPNS